MKRKMVCVRIDPRVWRLAMYIRPPGGLGREVERMLRRWIVSRLGELDRLDLIKHLPPENTYQERIEERIDETTR